MVVGLKVSFELAICFLEHELHVPDGILELGYGIDVLIPFSLKRFTFDFLSEELIFKQPRFGHLIYVLFLSGASVIRFACSFES